MSYHFPIAMRRTPPVRSGLGGFIEDFANELADKFGSSTLDAQGPCIDQANTATAPLDAKINSFATTWQPTGLYKFSDIAALLGQVMQMLADATARVAAAPQTASDSATMLAEAQDKINRAIGDGTKFAGTLATAPPGSQVQSSDFKDWVIQSMQRTSFALSVASVMNCNKTWLDNAMDWLNGVVDAVFRFAVAVGSEALDLAKAVVKVPGELADLTQNLLYLGLAGGAAYLFYELYYKKQKKKRR